MKIAINLGCTGSWFLLVARTLASPPRRRLGRRPPPSQTSLAKFSSSVKGAGFRKPKSPNASAGRRGTAVVFLPCAHNVFVEMSQ